MWDNGEGVGADEQQESAYRQSRSSSNNSVEMVFIYLCLFTHLLSNSMRIESENVSAELIIEFLFYPFFCRASRSTTRKTVQKVTLN